VPKQEVNNDKGTVRLEETSFLNHTSNLGYWNQLEALNFSILIFGNKIFREFQIITKQHITFETVLIDVQI
jgi:hypothetical protein